MLLDADKIKSIRLDKGWTQEQLAHLCSVSVRTIQRIEKTGIASLETTNSLTAVIGCERNHILVTEGVKAGHTQFSLLVVVGIALSMLLVGIMIGVII